jgi:hypothetical protein
MCKHLPLFRVLLDASAFPAKYSIGNTGSYVAGSKKRPEPTISRRPWGTSRQLFDYARRRRTNGAPTKPNPNSSNDAGSGVLVGGPIPAGTEIARSPCP